MPKAALYTAAAIFALVSRAHWARAVMGSELTIGDTAIPASVSVSVGILTAGLAAWMVHASRKI